MPSCFQAGVVDHVLHAVLCLEQLDDVAAPLAPAVGRKHGVQRHMAARVGGEPVVRKHAVGRGWRAPCVVEQVHAHPGGLQPRGSGGDFGIGEAGGSSGGWPDARLWKALSAAVSGLG
jgi:hypothetical protein